MNFKNNISKIILGIVLSAGFLLAPYSQVSALVLQNECSSSGSTSEICSSADASSDVSNIVKTITDVMFFIIGALAVVMIIYSGIRYTTSAGNPAGVTAAKNSLTYSIVGLVVAILSYAIVNFIVSQL